MILVKTGWSEFYRGDAVTGAHEHVRKYGNKSGAERHNFSPDGGTYYGYCPPHAPADPPKPRETSGWTVIWIAKNPKHSGVHIVGVYYNATLHHEYRTREFAGDEAAYCITAKRALFVHPDFRNRPFKSPIRSAPYMYIEGGPGLDREELAASLRRSVARLEKLEQKDAQDLEGGYGFADSRTARLVEKASERVARAYFRRQRWRIVEDLQAKRGYGVDFIVRRPNGQQLALELKGTQGDEPHCFLSFLEKKVATDRQREDWRLLMVTGALSRHPQITVYTSNQFRKAFDIQPVTFRAALKSHKLTKAPT
jgi:hypothetical protein